MNPVADSVGTAVVSLPILNEASGLVLDPLALGSGFLLVVSVVSFQPSASYHLETLYPYRGILPKLLLVPEPADLGN